MEVPGGLNNKKFILLNEVFGTAFLLIAINWTGGNIIPIAFTLSALIMINGTVGGANLNPAVSIGILIKERDQKMDKLIYFFMIVAAQIFGGFLGVSIVFAGVQTTDQRYTWPVQPAMLAPHQIENPTQLSEMSILFQTALVEMFCTFLFVSHVIQIIKHNGDQWDHLINSMAIGYGLLTCLFLSGNITGGCLNPAVGMVQVLFQVWYFSYLNFDQDKNPRSLDSAFEVGLYLVYIFAPLLGGIFAGLFQRYINEYNLRAAEENRSSVFKSLGQGKSVITNKSINDENFD